jgi:hypothetical protein
MAALLTPKSFEMWFPFSGLGMLGVVVLATGRKSRRGAGLGMLVLVMMFLISCGGSSTATKTTSDGTYKITVTATSGAVSRSAVFNLVVK